MSRRLLPLVLAVLLPACASTYDSRYSYQPRPIEVAVPAPGGGPAVQTLVTLMGLRNANKDENIPRSIEARIRLENLSDQPVRFDPASLQMFSADLQPFGRPIVTPAEPFDIAPKQVIIVTALFPVPETRADLNGVNLRYTLIVQGQPMTASATFGRERPMIIEDDRPRFHFGVGTFHRL